MPKKLSFLLIFLLSVCFISAQTPSDGKKSEETEKLRKDAVVFLRETMAEVNAMRSLENRLSFGAEMASLMWFHDEKEARALYLGVTGDFRQLLVEFDTQLNALAQTATSEDDGHVTSGFMAEITTKANLTRKVRKALEMRQQIALSLAEHEPDMAMAFYYDSVNALTNPEARGQVNDRDTYFELQLTTQIAETNAAKAAQYAVKSLDKGVNYQHIELLKKIYAKDDEKGIELASAMVSKIKSNKADYTDMWLLSSLVNYAEETASKPAKPKAKKPVMTPQDIRDLVEVMAQAVLAADDENDMSGGYTALFEKYTPTRAAQIKAKYRSKTRGSSIASATNAVAYAANTAANAAATAANTAAVAGPLGADADRRAKLLEERAQAEKKVMEDVSTLGTKQLSKDERQKIVTEARKIISQTPGKEKKIAGLSSLAAQVAQIGDKDLAAEIMKEAESFVGQQPKNYQDYMLVWMLISGYAEVNKDKAFPMLTDTILRLNDTISAFIKAAEFIDVQGEIMDDGEVQVGQFGGAMLRGLTKELKIAEPTLRSLAKADFAKTKAATNTFDRAEVRILAKMLVIRTILGKENPTPDDPDIGLVFN